MTFVVLAIGVGAFALLQSLVNPALPTIQAALGTSQADVTWVMTAYLLSAAICTPIVGRLGDMNGRKKMFIVALLALAAGSVLAALATSLPLMIAARVVQGIGGGVLPLSFGVIRDVFPAGKVSGAVGLMASVAAAGAGIGLVLTGPIVSVLSYHWLFWIPFIVVTVAAAAAALLIPESEAKTRGRINFVAALLMSGWLIALLVAVSQGPSWGWGSPRVWGLLIGAVVLCAIWVVIEVRSSNPLVDMRMLAVRAVWTNNLVALLVGVAVFAMLGFLPAFLQTSSAGGYGFSASITESGVMLLPQALFAFIAGLAAGRLSRWVSVKALLIAGALISSGAMTLLSLAHTRTWEIYVATGVSGIGFGLAFSSMATLIVNAVPREQTGVASGMNANIRTIGGSLGAAAMASVVTADLGPSGQPLESGYTRGFLMLAAALLLAAIAAALIPGAPRRAPADHLDSVSVPQLPARPTTTTPGAGASAPVWTADSGSDSAAAR